MNCTMNNVTRLCGLSLIKKVYDALSKMWSGVCSSLAHMEVYDCEADAYRESLDKIENKIDMCYFVGYPNKYFG